VSVYRRGDTWWYKFRFAGQTIRETAKTSSKTVAREAERARRRQLEQGFNRIERQAPAQLFSVAAENWLDTKKAHLSPRSVAIEQVNLKHLNPYFAKMLICEIRGEDIARYQATRQEDGAAPKTINLEVGTIRAILRKNRLWFAIQQDVRMLRVFEDVGRAISRKEENALLSACQSSRSRSLYTAVVLALSTCMRYSELRLLRWSQVDFGARQITVGASKTEAGSGRVLFLNDRALAVVKFWAGLFPDREAKHYVFPYEKYGLAQRKDQQKGSTQACVHSTDPMKPIGRWKEAWETAKKTAGVSCRFHDLRHTGCTRMLEAGIPFSVVASVMGWSASTTVRMSRRYGHIGQAAQKRAMETLSEAVLGTDGAQNRAQSESMGSEDRRN